MKKYTSLLFILLGLIAIIIGLVADLIRSGDPGIGPRQIALIVFGVFLLICGFIQHFNLEWRRIFDGPPVNKVQLLRMTIGFGLLTGLLEDLALVTHKWIFGTLFNLNPHLFWMKPLATLLLFSVIGAIFMTIVRKRPSFLSLYVVSSVFIFLTLLAFVLSYPQLHILAQLLLALGLTVQALRTIHAHPDKFDIFLRYMMPINITLTIAICLGFYSSKTVSENRALARLTVAKPDSPNILLLVMDTVRAKSLSVYGYDRPTTPNLEQFARTGVCFENAISTSPWTLPSHATMFTGRYPHELFKPGQSPLDAMTPITHRYPTLAEFLSKHGYVTAGFVANVGLLSRSFGIARGFLKYEDYVPTFRLFLSSSVLIAKSLRKIFKSTNTEFNFGRKRAVEINQSFLKWVSDVNGRPFFAFINYFDAHDPYVAPKPFELKFGHKRPRNLNVIHNIKYNKIQIQALKDAYESCIAYLDHQIGNLLLQLRKRGLLENTIVIITSDHGEQFGEHRLMYHVNSLYQPLLHVPLMISFPKHIPAGKRVKTMVSLRNLPATILDLIGVRSENIFPGFSLKRFWQNRSMSDNTTDTLFAEVYINGKKPDWFSPQWPVNKGSMQTLISEGYKFIQYGDGSEEIFNLEEDPEELNNLIASDKYQKLRIRLKNRLSFLKTPELIGWSKP